MPGCRPFVGNDVPDVFDSRQELRRRAPTRLRVLSTRNCLHHLRIPKKVLKTVKQGASVCLKSMRPGPSSRAFLARKVVPWIDDMAAQESKAVGHKRKLSTFTDQIEGQHSSKQAKIGGRTGNTASDPVGEEQSLDSEGSSDEGPFSPLTCSLSGDETETTGELASDGASERYERDRRYRDIKWPDHPHIQFILRHLTMYRITHDSLRALKKEQLPQGLRLMEKDLKRFATGAGVLSSRYWENEIRKPLSNGAYHEDENLLNFTFITGSDRERLGRMPELVDIIGVRDVAIKQRRLNESSLSWETVVHYSVVALAQRYSTHNYTQTWTDLAATAIVPKDLKLEDLPPQYSLTKGLDYSLVLQPDEEHARLLRVARPDPCRYDPRKLEANFIAASIVSTGPDQAGADQIARLSSWCSVRAACLRQFLREAGYPDAKLPFFPLVLAQGHEWKFYCFRDHIISRSGTFYESGIVMGRTDTLQGVYQIIACLQYLMDWANRVYRPWFEEFILESLLEDE